jgi:molybdenum cofactor cytidylyltransferase
MNWAIILAAGLSRRMGAPKVLLPMGGSPVILRIVDVISRSRVDGILVVVGRERDRIAEALRGREVRIVENPDPEGDMLSSVRCGLRALPEGCESVLVVLGDQPRIAPETIDALIDAHRAHRKDIVVPVRGGTRGHPLLFAARFGPEILERFDGVGLRGLLAAHPEELLEVEVSDPSVLCDMDDPEDYRRELDALGP